MKGFFDCKDEKITEKAFLQSVIISVVGFLLCIVVLCTMTYAWFSSETSSTANTLMSGSFDVTISVSEVEDGVAAASTIEAESNNEGKYSYTLDAGTYEICLTLTEGSNVKGYCVVKIGSDEERHTDAIIGENTANVEAADITNPFTFKITLTEETTVILEPRWGIAAVSDIQNGMVIDMTSSVDSASTEESSESVE